MKEMILRGLQQAYENMVHMIAEFLPRFVVMFIIMSFGWLVALLLKYLVRAILHLTKLDRLSEESGASQVLRKAALPSISELLSRAFFWVTWVAFALVGISVLGIPVLHEQISRLFQLLPEVFVAILILFVGVLAANFLSRAALLGAVNAGYRAPRLWSGTVRFVIWILTITMALEQIGLAKETVITAFSIFFGAVMLALAVSFGIGGRDLARQILERHLGENHALEEAREDVVNAPQQATETYHELRMTLPPLLPSYLASQRWFGGKARQIRSAEITDLVPMGNTHLEAFALPVRLEYTTGPGETYVLPLICTEEPTRESAATGLTVHSTARGTDLHLRNALTDDDFLHGLLQAIEQRAVFRGFEGEIHAASTSVFLSLCGASSGALQPKPIKAEQSNSSIIYGDRVILKFFRRVEEGENPDLEIGRFLTERKNFPHIPAVAGWLDYKGKDDREMSLGILQAFVPNVGDAWQFTLKALSSFWKEARKYAEGQLGRVSQDAGPVASYRQTLPAPVLDYSS